MLTDSPLAAVDATGLESCHTSRYYVHRKGYKRFLRYEWPKSEYRRQMKTQFDKELFNQRWQVESAYSRNKRLLGSFLRGRTDSSRERDCLLRILTHNLMILRRAA